MKKKYFAKSSGNRVSIDVFDHLSRVARRAYSFGEEFNRGEEAYTAGMLHDFGKYSDLFQQVLTGTRTGVDHAICGAALADYLMLRREPKTNKRVKNNVSKSIIEAIYGHHRCLTSYNGIHDELQNNLKGKLDQMSDGRIPALSGEEEYKKAISAFRDDFPDFIPMFMKKRWRSFHVNSENTGLAYSEMLFSRMLFSCLVDADYSESAIDDNPDYLRTSENLELNPDMLLENLIEYKVKLTTKAKEHQCTGTLMQKKVNAIRDSIFKMCGEAGEREGSGLFKVTAPTGTGKTLALLHFALRHCKKYGKRRIIVVLPFLTLTEQTVKDTYSKIIPTELILEDHSQSNLGEEERILAERWSAPFIVTTSVKFFESLFAARPTDCRKLHNISNSVIIFDEAQTLPSSITRSTLFAVNELCSKYNSTMVFSTATQPEFDAIPEIMWKPREIIDDYKTIYNELRRVVIDWRLKERISLSTIAESMALSTSSCAIVNLRRHAKKIYQQLTHIVSEGEVFYLTTDLCPAHRSRIVEDIHRRMDEKKPCRVVATQCIEAGVDLDFDQMFRALAPLEAIIQAAGRCNRNGRLGENGKVCVFIPDEEGRLYPDNHYKDAALTVKYLSDEMKIDIDNPDHIRSYYERLFDNLQHDKETLETAVQRKNYETVANEYKLIEKNGVQVIVPYREEMELFNTIEREIKTTGLTKAMMKKAAPITVSSFRTDIEDYAEPLPIRNGHNGESRSSGYYILRPQYYNCYSVTLGLQFPEKEQMDYFY